MSSKPDPYHTTTAVCLRGLRPPSTLIRHENGAFRSRTPHRRNLKKTAFRFSVDGKRLRT